MLDGYELRLAKQLGLIAEEYTSKAAQPITTSVAQDASGVGLKKDIPDQFIDLMVDESVLLKNVRIVRTDKPSGDIAKIDVNGPVTELASENGTSSETRTHTPSSVPYVNKKLRSQFDITTEVEEDNIESATGVSTILGALMKAIMNDTETLAIEGDDSLGGTDDQSRLLKANDGWNVQTAAGTGTHQLVAGNKQVSWRLLSDMLAALPTRYRGGNWRSRYKFVMSPNAFIRLQNEAQTRATGLGDGFWNNNQQLSPLGVDIMEIPLIPEDLSAAGTDSTGTFIWLVDPRNLIYVIQREMTVHREFIPRFDRTEFTVFHRNDYIIENTDAIVKATGVLTDPDAARYGV